MDTTGRIVLDAAKFRSQVAEAMGDDVLPSAEMDAIMDLALRDVQVWNPGVIVEWGTIEED